MPNVPHPCAGRRLAAGRKLVVYVFNLPVDFFSLIVKSYKVRTPCLSQFDLPDFFDYDEVPYSSSAINVPTKPD